MNIKLFSEFDFCYSEKFLGITCKEGISAGQIIISKSVVFKFRLIFNGCWDCRNSKGRKCIPEFGALLLQITIPRNSLGRITWKVKEKL